MSSAYGHAIVRLTKEEEYDFNRPRGGGPGQCSEYILRCSADTRKRACHERVKWRASYRYVTGKSGRTTRSERRYCDRHALRFCAMNSLPIPEDLGEHVA